MAVRVELVLFPSYYQRQVCDLSEHWKNGNNNTYFKGLL